MNAGHARAGFVKICGMTDESAVRAALDAGADAIGFVFAKSVRHVTPEQANVLAQPARGKLLCVAVTLHPDAALREEIFKVFRPDVWQSDAEDLAGAKPPAGVATWPVLRGVPGLLPVSVTPGQPLLFEGPRSGTGKVADWSAARLLASVHRLILAGGLSPANVSEAIDAVRPFGVDVSSGVEAAPGQKSAELIHAFVSQARLAFAAARRMN
jgi:phosphoribosylanthranilate isomerase